MIHPLNLGPDNVAPPVPEEIDPLLLLPLTEDERFFTSLPERQPVQPWALIFSVAIQIALGVFIYYQQDNILNSPKNLQAAIKRYGRDVESGTGEQRRQVMLAPQLPQSLNRMPPPSSSVPPSAKAVPTPPQTPQQQQEQAKIDERMRKYTHINQDEQAKQAPNEKNLFSDRDRKGASPDTAAHPDRRNPDPVSQGTDARRNALSAPGPDVPGEPGTHEKLAGAPGSGKTSGVKGENGTQMAENSGRPAFNPSTNSHYGVPLDAGSSRYRQGQADNETLSPPASAGRPANGKNNRNGDATVKKPGAPGEAGEIGSDGEQGQASIRHQLSELARQGASSIYRNPTGKNYQMGSMSFDTQGYELGDYDRQVHQAVEREWNPPSVTMGLGIHGCTLATFVIEQNGTVSEVTLVNTSSVDPYDQAALSAIKNAHLPKLPASIKLKRMTTTFGFFINEGMSDRCGTALKGK